MPEISNKKRKFIKRNYKKLSVEEVSRQTGLKPHLIRQVVAEYNTEKVIRDHHASKRRLSENIPAEKRSVHRAGVAFAAIIFLTLTAYAPALQNNFIWDDDDYVTNNLTLRDINGLGRIWFEIGAVPQYYPLVHTSFWIEYHLWQLKPFGYHLVNVLLHSLNAILLWFLLRRLSIPGAWLAATVFALHPVHVETVAWITERKNLLSGCFFLSSILLYLRFYRFNAEPYDNYPAPSAHTVSSSAVSCDWGLYLLAFGLFLCSLLSKTVTCTMPAAILLLLWWKRDRIVWRDIILLIPFFLAGIVFSLITVWM